MKKKYKNNKTNSKLPDLLHDESIFYGEFIGTYCKFVNAKTIVEIGVQTGNTTVELCNAAKLTNGKVFGYDIFEPYGAYKTKKVGQSKSDVEERLKSLGYEKYFKITKCNTQEEDFNTILSNDLSGSHEKIDVAFIDGCHSYEGVLNDFKKVYQHLSKDGSIIFHDSYSHIGIRKFVLEDLYEKLNDGTFDIINLPFGETKKKKIRLGSGDPGYACRLGLTILVKRSFPGTQGITNTDHESGTKQEKSKAIKKLYSDELEWLNSKKKAYKNDS